jgi:hypothetical protein
MKPKRRRWLLALTLSAAGLMTWYRFAHKRLPEPLADAFRHALAQAQRIPDWNRDFALETLVEAEARAGDAAGAEETLRKIEDPSWAQSAAESIAVKQALDGEPSPFWKRVRSWMGRKVPDADRGQLVNALVAVGRLQDAQRVADSVGDPGKKSGALRDVAVARIKSGDIEGATAMTDTDALGYFRSFVLMDIAAARIDRKERGVANWTIDRALKMVTACDTAEYDYQYYQILVRAAGERNRLGDHEGALALLWDGLRRCSSVPDAQAKSYNISEILESYAAICEDQRALSLAETRLNPKEREWAYRLISSAIARRGDSSASRIAMRIQDPMKKDQAIRGVALGYAHRKDFSAAMRAEALIGDPMKRQLSAHFVVIGLARAGRFPEARAELAKMQPGYDQPRALQGLCRILARRVTVEEAMREASTAVTPVDRAYGYIGVAQGWMDRDRATYPAFMREDVAFDRDGN